MRTLVMLSLVAVFALACATTENNKADPVEPAKTDAPVDAPPADAPPADAPPADAPAPAPAAP